MIQEQKESIRTDLIIPGKTEFKYIGEEGIKMKKDNNRTSAGEIFSYAEVLAGALFASAYDEYSRPRREYEEKLSELQKLVNEINLLAENNNLQKIEICKKGESAQRSLAQRAIEADRISELKESISGLQANTLFELHNILKAKGFECTGLDNYTKDGIVAHIRKVNTDRYSYIYQVVVI